jgi:hypothetical protein
MLACSLTATGHWLSHPIDSSLTELLHGMLLFRRPCLAHREQKMFEVESRHVLHLDDCRTCNGRRGKAHLSRCHVQRLLRSVVAEWPCRANSVSVRDERDLPACHVRSHQRLCRKGKAWCAHVQARGMHAGPCAWIAALVWTTKIDAELGRWSRRPWLSEAFTLSSSMRAKPGLWKIVEHQI